MATSFVVSLQDLWDAWGIRGFMIVSLTMQLLLAIVYPLRKRTSNRWVILLIWSAYFLADWVAIFAFGLISNARCRNSTSNDQDLLAFWSAFLLIHLGGSDSITAYSLEDNTLWLRHLVGLVAQVLAFLNIFVKTLPSNELRVPTILIAIAGAIKYGERTRALYLASVENLKESSVKSCGFGLDRNTTRTEGVAPQSNTGGSNSEEFAGLCCRTVEFPEWSESTGALSILGCAFEESRPRKGSKLSDYWRKINSKLNDKMGIVIFTKLPYQWKNNLDMELWDFVYSELKEKARCADDVDKVRAIYEARGEGPLSIGNLAELRHFVDDFEFEHSILIWHCATEICYRVDAHVDGENNNGRKFSKVFSDYMTYLSIKQPKLMSPVAGIEEIRYRETIAEAKDIGKTQSTDTLEQFCWNTLDEHTGTAESDEGGSSNKSVLPEACTLTNILTQKGTMKWDVISKVWVEMLLYTAGHCRADSHVRLLSEGGEFITFVWLLMAHMGIIARFPKE